MPNCIKTEHELRINNSSRKFPTTTMPTRRLAENMYVSYERTHDGSYIISDTPTAVTLSERCLCRPQRATWSQTGVRSTRPIVCRYRVRPVNREAKKYEFPNLGHTSPLHTQAVCLYARRIIHTVCTCRQDRIWKSLFADSGNM